MEEKLVSVIVPVYNVEKYLKRCIDSILNQSYSNLEIILVDDGSTDNSGKIVDEYGNLDKRIRVIHQKNQGLSAARNTGLEIMHGEYVTFIDSDDYVTNDYVSYLYKLISQTNFSCKMSLCSLMNVYASGKKVNCGDGSKAILSGKECIKEMCYQHLVDTCAYAKLAHRDLYNKVKFPVGKLYEDIGTTYLLFDQCDKIACGFEPKYFYVIRENSIVTGKYNSKKLELLTMTDKMAAYVSEKYPDLKDATLRRQVYARFSTLNQMFNVSKTEDLIERDKIIDFLKIHRTAILKNKLAPKRDKIAFIILSLGWNFYKIAWSAYQRKVK